MEDTNIYPHTSRDNRPRPLHPEDLDSKPLRTHKKSFDDVDLLEPSFNKNGGGHR
jgi:hypothetical protein